jgi:hypothetical protein
MSDELKMKVISVMTEFGLGFDESRRLIRHLESENIGFVIKPENPALSDVEKFAGVKIPGGRLAMPRETYASIIGTATMDTEIRSRAWFVRDWLEQYKLEGDVGVLEVRNDSNNVRISVEDFLKIELI